MTGEGKINCAGYSNIHIYLASSANSGHLGRATAPGGRLGSRYAPGSTEIERSEIELNNAAA